jgi:S1-C subfamily serine protease
MPLPALPLVLALVATGDTPGARTDLISALETAIGDAIAKAEPSVVAIARVRNEGSEETTAVRGLEPRHGVRGDIDDGDFRPLPRDFGSGVVVSEDGAILTTYHMVKGAARLRVRAPGRQAFDAEIIAADPRSDLAAIAPRLGPGEPRPNLTPVAIGKTETLRKGAFVILLGNPYSSARDAKASASWGILANTARQVTRPEVGPFDPKAGEILQKFQYQPTLLQLDAKLNLGMSGGAAINLKGELVGISTNGGDAEGFDAQAGYAIPMDDLGRRAVDALREGREVEYGFLGISLDANNRVQEVYPGTPAEQCGLLIGDAIAEVNGTPVELDGSLTVMLSRIPVGEPAKLTIARKGESLQKTVLVAKFPIAGQVIATNRPKPWRGIRVEHPSVTAVRSLSDAARAALERGCVYVTDVEAGSAAAQADLKPRTYILEVDGRHVASPREFARAVAGKTGPVRLKTELGDVVVKE